MAKNYRNFRKGSRIRTRRMNEAVFNGMDFNGRKRDHGVTQALNLGQKRKRPGLVEAVGHRR